MRLAEQMAQAMDRLLVEQIGPEELLQDRVLDLVGDMTEHWRRGIRLFMRVQARWLDELMARGEVDPADRRNRLFRTAAKKWRADPPEHPIVAAGVTSAAPLLARLLRVVSELPKGAVILPDLDLSLADEVWGELGVAGAPENKGDPPFGRHDAVTHPQYHLKLLLNRMGINRAEVQSWHRAGLGKGPPERSHAISSLFLPPTASRTWAELSPEKRRLAGVRVMTSADPEEEAQAIALLLREALEQPERRAALVTPDRGLAGRVVAHLARWNIRADDTAGRPLSQTAAGRVLLLLAEIMAEDAAPVPLMALLGHPLVGAGEGRTEWLERVRALELKLRGPRHGPGFAPYRSEIAKLASTDEGVSAWWNGVEAVLSPLLDLAEQDAAALAEQVDALAAAGEALCGQALWAREDGRALSALVEELRRNVQQAGTLLAPGELHVVLRDRMDLAAVRPPWGGHPRLAIYGLLEARMSRADLVICGGLNEGSWPPAPAQDPLLAPAVLRALGVPSGDFRIGLAAHDLAGMLGAPEVVLSRAERDAGGPAIPSRFLLRVEALLGERLLGSHREKRAVELARALNAAPPPPNYEQPKPMPSPEQRDVAVSVTALDTLRSDPYQFYARAILGLRRLDALDEEPSAAWKGTLVHEILRRWHEEGGKLHDVARKVLDAENVHPLMRAVWLPRLLEGLEWVESELAAFDGREVIAWERKGEMQVDGVKIHGRADRIDRLSDGKLTIVDYKTGSPPSAKRVKEGFSLQLGLIGMMAEGGGIAGVSGEAAQFEYWSLARKGGDFGYIASPVKTERNRAEIQPGEFTGLTRHYLDEAIGKWIKGEEPFTARLNPNLEVYTDYDQLMRLEEWLGREEDGA
jgi:ATP-dependent helicase/nuclease subunit B